MAAWKMNQLPQTASLLLLLLCGCCSLTEGSESAESQNPSVALPSENDDEGSDDVLEQEEAERESFRIWSACRRDPAWKENYDGCSAETGWDKFSRDTYWWEHDPLMSEFYEAHEVIEECLEEALETHGFYDTTCTEDSHTHDEDEFCYVSHAQATSSYAHEYEGDLVTVQDALTEHEAVALHALVLCIHEILPQELPFYQVRPFGNAYHSNKNNSETSRDDDNPENADEEEDGELIQQPSHPNDEKGQENEEFGMYKKQGGNHVTFLAGLLQYYLPGVASSLYHAVTLAYDHAQWHQYSSEQTAYEGRYPDEGLPHPTTLGFRTIEHLHYKQTGRLGQHTDSGSTMTISVALSDETEFEGGYFQLLSDHALFKVPRLSAVVFLSEASHGITPITSGSRTVFVAELWMEDDVPLGIARPNHEDFEEYKEERRQALDEEEEEEVAGEAAGRFYQDIASNHAREVSGDDDRLITPPAGFDDGHGLAAADILSSGEL